MNKKYFLLLFFICISIIHCTQSKEESEYSQYYKIALPDSVPDKEVILRFSGMINSEEPVSLDLNTIMSFPETGFKSIDPWDDNIEHEFKGVLLFPLLKRIGISGSVSKIDITAENDYKVTIGIDDIEKYEYLLVYEIDGEMIHNNPDFRPRGSIMIAINFDKYQELDIEIYKFHLAWQVKEINIR